VALRNQKQEGHKIDIVGLRGRGDPALARFLVLVVLLFSHFAAHLTLKLMKSQDLIRRQYTTHLSANPCVQPDLLSLRRRKIFGSPSNFSFAIWLAHDRAVERLPGLPQASAGRNDFVLVTAANLLHTHALIRRKPDRLHHTLLQLLLSDLIWITASSWTQLRAAKWAVDTSLSWRDPIVAPNLGIALWKTGWPELCGSFDRDDRQKSREQENREDPIHI
jgi:hypothetical protein